MTITASPIPAPIPVVTAEPNTRLESLCALYADAKATADAAAERLKEITDGIKAELAAAAPGETKVDLRSPLLPCPLRMQATKPWYLDSKRLKSEDPLTYVRYAVQGTKWELRQVSG